MYTANEVAHIIADLLGDVCACNFGEISKWLPQYCDVIESCPEPFSAACLEQYLKYRDRTACWEQYLKYRDNRLKEESQC